MMVIFQEIVIRHPSSILPYPKQWYQPPLQQWYRRTPQTSGIPTCQRTGITMTGQLMAELKELVDEMQMG